MCNLNIFIKSKKTKTNKELLNIMELINNTTTNSFLSNSNGEGFYFDYTNKITKGLNKLNVLNFKNDIKKSNIILTHQRIITSGFKEKYTQPFKNSEFVLLHNGVMSNFVDGDKSDTFIFFEKFLKHYSRYLKTYKDREESIKKSIQKLLKANVGSYSICIYDIKTKNLYYFKNDKTKINFLLNKDNNFLFITTNTDNINLLDFRFKDKFNILKAENYIIYKIKIKNRKIKINKLCNLENKPKMPEPIYYSYNPKKNKYKKKYNKDRVDYYDYSNSLNDLNFKEENNPLKISREEFIKYNY